MGVSWDVGRRGGEPRVLKQPFLSAACPGGWPGGRAGTGWAAGPSPLKSPLPSHTFLLLRMHHPSPPHPRLWLRRTCPNPGPPAPHTFPRAGLQRRPPPPVPPHTHRHLAASDPGEAGAGGAQRKRGPEGGFLQLSAPPPRAPSAWCGVSPCAARRQRRARPSSLQDAPPSRVPGISRSAEWLSRPPTGSRHESLCGTVGRWAFCLHAPSDSTLTTSFSWEAGSADAVPSRRCGPLPRLETRVGRRWRGGACRVPRWRGPTSPTTHGGCPDVLDILEPTAARPGGLGSPVGAQSQHCHHPPALSPLLGPRDLFQEAPAESGAGGARPQEPSLPPSWRPREDPTAGLPAGPLL